MQPIYQQQLFNLLEYKPDSDVYRKWLLPEYIDHNMYRKFHFLYMSVKS